MSPTAATRRDISPLGSWEVRSRFYAGKKDRAHPWISPVFADLAGLPPIFIQVGSHDILLHDARTFAARAQAASVERTPAVLRVGALS